MLAYLRKKIATIVEVSIHNCNNIPAYTKQVAIKDVEYLPRITYIMLHVAAVVEVSML